MLSKNCIHILFNCLSSTPELFSLSSDQVQLTNYKQNQMSVSIIRVSVNVYEVVSVNVSLFRAGDSSPRPDLVGLRLLTRVLPSKTQTRKSTQDIQNPD